MTTAKRKPAKQKKVAPPARRTVKKTAPVARRKPVQGRPSPPPAAATKRPAAKAPVAGAPAAESPRYRASAEEKFRMIQEAAYLIAEKDGFHKHPDQYWLAAEKQIAALLAGR